MASRCSHHLKLLVHPHNGAGWSRRQLRSPLALYPGKSLLPGKRRLKGKGNSAELSPGSLFHSIQIQLQLKRCQLKGTPEDSMTGKLGGNDIDSGF